MEVEAFEGVGTEKKDVYTKPNCFFLRICRYSTRMEEQTMENRLLGFVCKAGGEKGPERLQGGKSD